MSLWAFWSGFHPFPRVVGQPVDFVEIVANSRIFSNMSTEFVKELAGAAVDRIFMPGACF